MAAAMKRVPALFWRSAAGREPAREFLQGLAQAERRLVGEDIKKVEFGWPIGMPTARPLGQGLHEVRTSLGNRICRVLFYVSEAGNMVLLHAFIKKTNRTPPDDIRLARRRMDEHRRASPTA